MQCTLGNTLRLALTLALFALVAEVEGRVECGDYYCTDGHECCGDYECCLGTYPIVGIVVLIIVVKGIIICCCVIYRRQRREQCRVVRTVNVVTRSPDSFQPHQYPRELQVPGEAGYNPNVPDVPPPPYQPADVVGDAVPSSTGQAEPNLHDDRKVLI